MALSLLIGLLSMLLVSFDLLHSNSSDMKISQSDGVKIVSWNLREIFGKIDVEQRKDDFKKASDELKPDILLIQEVTSHEEVEILKEEMGLNDYHAVCSDFVTDSQNHAGFEVAILSKYKLDEVIEYDPSTTISFRDDKLNNNEPNSPIYPTEKVMLDDNDKKYLKGIGLKTRLGARGYLYARIDQIKLCLYVVHLKSARDDQLKGDKYLKNSSNRESVAASVVLRIDENSQTHPTYAHFVAGDFNVGHSDSKKNGNDLREDCFSQSSNNNCNDKDPYDETHAIFSSGLIKNMRMLNLMRSISEETYLTRGNRFKGVGPIDNIYINQEVESKFSKASNGKPNGYDSRRNPRFFGSDHVAVWASYNPN